MQIWGVPLYKIVCIAGSAFYFGIFLMCLLFMAKDRDTIENKRS